MAEYTTIVDPGNEQVEWSTDYTSLNAWEAGEGSTGTSSDTVIADCRRSTTAKDTLSLLISGMSASPKVIVHDDYRHNAIMGDGYVLEPASGHTIRWYQDCEIDGLELSLTNASYCFYRNEGTIKASNIIIYNNDNNIMITNRGPATAHLFYNMIVYDMGSAVGAYIYQATIYNSVVYVRTGDGWLHGQFIKESICYNCIGYDVDGGRTYGVFYDCTGDYNLSSDDSAPGAHSLHNKTLTDIDFVSTTSGSEDFNLQSTSDAIGAGIGPSSDANVPTTDINGETRSGTTCDIGAAEYVAAVTNLLTNYYYTHLMQGGL